MKYKKQQPSPNEVEIQFEDSDELEILSLADVKPKAVRWLWPGRIPLAKIVLLGGVPSTGKTTISHFIAATITTGRRWPYSETSPEVGDVLILTSEDDPADTLVPRLMAAGADLQRVDCIRSVLHPRDDRTVNLPFLLSQDLDKLDKLLSERAETRLVIFDPLSAYFGVRDSHRDADVRQVLGPLGDLAAKHNVTVLGITHLSKNTGVSALARFMGSTGIIAASRAACLAVRHGNQNLLLPVKNNLAPLGRGLVYDIKSTTIRDDIETSRIEWTGETDIKADEVLAVVQKRTSSPALADAKDFLEDQLKDGPKRQVDIEAAAKLEKDNFSWTTVKRAKKELGIQSHRDRFTGGWKWYTKEQLLLMKSHDSKQLGTLRKDQGCQEPEFGTLGGKNAAKTLLKVNGDKGFSGSTEGCQTMEEISHSECSESTKGAKSRAWHSSTEKKVLL